MAWKSTANSTAELGFVASPSNNREYLPRQHQIEGYVGNGFFWGFLLPLEEDVGEEVGIVMDRVDHQFCDSFTGLETETMEFRVREVNQTPLLKIPIPVNTRKERSVAERTFDKQEEQR
jgi:hypothetical protein